MTCLAAANVPTAVTAQRPTARHQAFGMPGPAQPARRYRHQAAVVNAATRRAIAANTE